MAIKLNNRLLFLSLIFLAPFFPLVIKLGIGHVNTTFVAAIPVLFLLLIFGLKLIQILLNGKVWIGRIQYLDIFVFVYFSLGIIQFFNPNLPHIFYGLRGIHEHLIWILGYFIARLLFYSDHDCESLVRFIMLSSLLSCCYGILTMYVGVEHFERNYIEFIAREDNLFVMRSVGTIASPFGFGLLCAIGVGALWSLSSSMSFKLNNFFLFLTFICFWGGIFISSSRTTIVGAVFASIIILVFQKKRFNFTKILKIFIVIIVVSTILIFVIIYFKDNLFVKRMLSILSFNEEQNVLARFVMWGNLFFFAEKNPFGYGTGSLGAACYRYGSIVGNNTVADNNYLEIFIEQGVFGAVFYLFILAISIITSASFFMRDKKGISKFVLFISVLFAVSSLGGPPLKAYPGNFYFWVVLGAFSANKAGSVYYTRN